MPRCLLVQAVKEHAALFETMCWPSSECKHRLDRAKEMSAKSAVRVQADILNLINDFFGFEYEQETPWHAVFAEPPTSPRARPASAAAAPLTFASVADLMACADLPETDSDSSYRCVRAFPCLACHGL